MKLKYSLTKDDFINFNLNYMHNSNSLKKTLFINRFIVPLIFLIIPFLLYDIADMEFIIFMITFILLFILWISFYNKFVDNINRKRLNKILNENNPNDLLGERVLEIIGDKIKITNSSGENIIRVNSIKKIIENDNYIFVYINSITAIIVPLMTFRSDEEKDTFKNLLSYHLNLIT